MRLILLLSLAAALSAQPVAPGKPVRFVAPADGLLHASLARDYDQVPGNLEIVGSEELRSYTPENTQTHPGVFAFRAALVKKGQEYEITSTQPGDVNLQFFPPSAEPKRAVEAGVSWLVRAADAWLSNQPRHGAIAKTGDSQHPEARSCVACHITQFTTRAYVTAVKNDFAQQYLEGADRIVSRLRANPRPLYGHEGVNWTRVIYSARTVSSRMPVLLSSYREAVGDNAEFDRGLILGAARFLLLSDECRLRPEADGSRPDVSAFEIGLQAMQTFELAARFEPANSEWKKQAACVGGALASTKPANVVDAAWQIAALARMRLPVREQVANLLKHQQSDGRFGMELSADSRPADFISYLVLYALASAHHRGPEIDRLRDYTLRSQRADGSWKGLPEYKGFDTPFRETQFAVMALSELYRGMAHGRISLIIQPKDENDPWRMTDRDASQRSILSKMADPKADGAPLIDALAGSLDENLGMLREWQRSMAKPEDGAKVEAALRADSQRAATLLASALQNGSRTLRLRVLTAMSTVVGLEGFVRKPRVGNDMEAPQILADADAALEKALLKCIDVKDREMTIAVIRGGTAMSDVLTPSFTKAMLRLTPTYGDIVEDAYGESGRGKMALSRDEANDPELVALVRETLLTRDPARLRLVLPMLSALPVGHRFTRESSLSDAMDALLRVQPDGPVLQAAGIFANVVDGPLMRTQVMKALASPDPAVARAVVDVVLDRYLVNPNVSELTIQYFAASRGMARRMLLDSLDPNRLRFDLNLVSAYSPPRIPIPLDGSILSAPFVQSFVLESLQSSDPQVQGAALDLTRNQAALRKNPAIVAAVTDLTQSVSARNQVIARAVVTKTEPVFSEPLLDFEYFRERIQPILHKAGPDGRSCVMCHASNARFPLRSDTAANFKAVAAKANLADPAASPLLVKPLLPGAAPDGDVFRTAHNGGERWPARTGSAEYQVILEWIRGATR